MPSFEADESDERPVGVDDDATTSEVSSSISSIDAPPSSSRLLRALGVTDGVLGVKQDRVEMVMKQALPVMGGMASQNVLNLADSVMVGRLGTACVASVGIASTLNFQCQAALQGISSGVQAMSARRIGEGRAEIAAVPLNAALVACVCLGVPMAALAFAAAPDIVPRLTSDPAVVAAAVPYLRARLLAVPAVGVNFAFRGFWNAVQQPQIYMNTLLVMHLVNVALSLLLIFGFKGVNLAPFGFAQNAFAVPALGVVGAGVGTTVSVWVGTALFENPARPSRADVGDQSVIRHGHDRDVLDRRAPGHRRNRRRERADKPDAHARFAVYGHGPRGGRAVRPSPGTRRRGGCRAVALGRR